MRCSNCMSLTRWHVGTLPQSAELKFIDSRIVSVERAVMPTQLADTIEINVFIFVVAVNYSHRHGRAH